MSKPHKLSLQDFLLSLTLAPRVVIELLVENKNGGIYLLKRKTPPFIDTWHLPGGFILKDEPIKDCVPRLFREELNSEELDWEFLKLVENIHGDPRGHLLHYIVKIYSDQLPETDDRQYFKPLPSNTMSFQAEILRDLGYHTSI